MSARVIDLDAVSNHEVEILSFAPEPRTLHRIADHPATTLDGARAERTGGCGGCGGNGHEPVLSKAWQSQWYDPPEALPLAVLPGASVQPSARRKAGKSPELAFVAPLEPNRRYENATPALNFVPIVAGPVVWRRLHGRRAYPLIDRFPRWDTDPGCATYHPFTQEEYEILAGAWVYAESMLPVPPRDAWDLPWTDPGGRNFLRDWIDDPADAAWAIPGDLDFHSVQRNLAWRLLTSLYNRGSVGNNYDTSDSAGPRIGGLINRRPLSAGGDWVRHADLYVQWIAGAATPPNLLEVFRPEDLPQPEDMHRLSVAAYHLQTELAWRGPPGAATIAMWLWTSCANVVRFTGYGTMDGPIQVGGWHPPSLGWWEPRRDGTCSAVAALEGDAPIGADGAVRPGGGPTFLGGIDDEGSSPGPDPGAGIICPPGFTLDCFLPTATDWRCVDTAVRNATMRTEPYFRIDPRSPVTGWTSATYVMQYNSFWTGFFELELDLVCPGLFPPLLRIGLADYIGTVTSVDSPIPYAPQECVAMRIRPPCGDSPVRGNLFGKGNLPALDSIEYCRCI